MCKFKSFLKQYSSILDFVVSFILGIIFSFSNEYLNNNLKLDFSFGILAKGVGLGIAFLIIAILFRFILNKCTNLNSKFEKLYSTKNISVTVLTIIIFIFWLPILIGMFPGTVINDTWGQLNQYYFRGFSDHNPIFDTLIMGAIILGIAKSTVVPHWQFAFFVFVLIQALLTAFSFAYTIFYSKTKLNLNNKLLTIVLVFYCILPIFPLAVQTISKDSIFSWIYVLFAVNFIEIIRSKGKSLKSVRGFILTLILSLLCLLTKKVGGYVVIGSLILLLIFEFKNLKKLSFIIAFLVLFMFVIEPNVLKMVNIELGGKQEKYSLLFQQTANYVKTYPNDLAEEEKKIIDNVLVYDTLVERYNPVNADNVKGYTQIGKDEDYGKYVKVWLKQGLRHPDAYIIATASMLSGSFSTSEYKPLTDMGWHSQLDTRLADKAITNRYGIFKDSSNLICKIYEKLAIGKIFSFGFWVTLAPAFICITLIKYRKNNNKIKGFIGVIPLILSIILGVWLAPVSALHIESMRYVYPIIYTVPIMILWCCYCIKEYKNKEEFENE